MALEEHMLANTLGRSRAWMAQGFEWMLMVLVTALAAALDFWRLTASAYGNAYYSAAVRSMAQNWHAFFFLAYDPNGFISVDKPPLGLWLQVASVKFLGYSSLSLLLPEALAGVAAVVVLWRVVRRSFGRAAGVIAALALAITPISVVASRDNILEPSLTLALLLAAWALIRALERSSWRWLLLSAVFLGLAFNIKMLEAYLIVPACALTYFWSGSVRQTFSDAALIAPLRLRLVQLAVAGAVMLTLSFSWVTIVQLTPASQRPYVGSTTTNSEFDLALGYNGIEKLLGAYTTVFFPQHRATPAAPLTPSHAIAGHGALSGSSSIGQPAHSGTSHIAQAKTIPQDLKNRPGVFRLIQPMMGSQVSWLLALALIGSIVFLAQLRTATDEEPIRRLARERGFVFWFAWLLTVGFCFSFAQAISLYYVDILAPAVSALVGVGTVALWQVYCQPRGAWGYALPLALALTGLEQGYLFRAAPHWGPPWLPVAIAGAGLSLGLALAIWRIVTVYRIRAAQHGASAEPARQRAGWTSTGFAALSLTLAALTPTAWTLGSLSYGNAGGWPIAGPEYASPEPANPMSMNPSLIHYLMAHRHGARYLVATVDSYLASTIMIATGQPVMAMGGFSGRDPALTPTRLDALVDTGQVRMFLISSTNVTPAQRAALLPSARLASKPIGASGSHTTEATVAHSVSTATALAAVHYTNDLTQWVSAYCAPVPLGQWGGLRNAPTRLGAWILYSCEK